MARELGLGSRVNTILQTCFFAISNVLPRERAIAAIKTSIEHAYGRKGGAVIEKNFAAVDGALAQLHEVAVPSVATGRPNPTRVPVDAPEFVRNVTALMLAGRGDEIPVSAQIICGSSRRGWPDANRWRRRRSTAAVEPGGSGQSPEWPKKPISLGASPS